MRDVDVLMLRPMMPMIAEQIGERFSLHKLWEQGDEEAYVAAIAPRVRALVVGTLPGFGKVDAAYLDRFPHLEIIPSFGVGYDQVDAVHAGRRGVVVTNTPDVLTDEVADFTIGLLIATLREIPQAERYLRAGRWLERPYPLSASLRGRRIGIIGYGRIGKAIAHRLDAFGVEVVWHGRRDQPGALHRHYPDLVAMARDCDVLVAITPGGPQTRHLVNAPVLEALGQNGVLINVARGSVVDEEALIAALRSKTILAAGLDVFADEPRVPQALIDCDNAVLVPHIASGSVYTRNAMAQLVVDNLVSWFSGKGALTPVPETPAPSVPPQA